jgi:type VI secretion system secreted protein Hcp
MAKTDCFLKLDGIDAESEDEKLPGWIQVNSWNWNISAGESGGQRATRASASTFDVTHNADRSSAALMKACISNKLIKKGELIQRRAGGSAPQVFIRILFKNLRVSKVIYVHGNEGGIPQEQVGLTFDAIEFDYTPQSSGGANKSGPASVSWDIMQK